MKQRSPSYLGTFVNSPEGNSSYKLMIHHIRQVVNGGRFVKMYRGNKRPWKMLMGKYKYYQGSSLKEGATHFDVYLNGNPTFYGFKLVPNRPW